MHLAQCISVRSLRIGSICNFSFSTYDLQKKGKTLILSYILSYFFSYRICADALLNIFLFVAFLRE